MCAKQSVTSISGARNSGLSGQTSDRTTDLLCTAWIRKGTYFAKEDDQHPECVLSNPSLPSPAPEILDYLARHQIGQLIFYAQLGYAKARTLLRRTINIPNVC